MSIIDLTRTDHLTAAPDTPVGDVAAAMRDHDEECVVVLDEQRPLGVLAAADIGRAFVAGERLEDRRASDLLAGDPVLLDVTADRESLIFTFEDEGVDRVLVVDDGDFVGVVTREALLASYGRELTDILGLFDGE